MMPVLFSLLLPLRNSFRERAALQAEILALRHQLLILQRANRNQRLELSAADRTLWVWLSRFWPGWRSVLLIVKPETVIAWHRKGFRLYWTWKSRVPNGRPSVLKLSLTVNDVPAGWAAEGFFVSTLTVRRMVQVDQLHTVRLGTARAATGKVERAMREGGKLGTRIERPKSQASGEGEPLMEPGR
jgi:hypothetical protein